MLSLDTKTMYLKGVGEKKAILLLKELNISTLRDLMYYFPFKYIDRTKFYDINKISAELPYIQIKGEITSFKLSGEGKKQRLIAKFTDGTGVIELLWFKGIKWITQNYRVGQKYIVFGKPTEFKSNINIVHPEIEDLQTYEKERKSSVEAAYNTTEKLKKGFITSKTIQKLQYNLFKSLSEENRNFIEETLPDAIIKQAKLISLKEALINIHFPQSPEKLQKANVRLKFEELFYIQLNILYNKIARLSKFQGFVFSTVGNYFNKFYTDNLEFELTNAQKKVLKEIRRDLGSGKQMNRLLQGDVGSGKTLIALMSILIAMDNNYQTCLMAPTAILAQQHFVTINEFLEGLNINCKLLIGSTRKKQRDIIHKELIDGDLQILIGTHAVIEDVVKFKNLGLVIIDEQHRFGVAQRARLWKKNVNPPHILVMTATPIPRTLAMTLYGDLEVSVIDELPPGRKAIKTLHQYDNQRLKIFGFIKKQIELGRQIYIVYPLISESEKLDYKDLEDGYESISRAFPPPDYAVSIVHGKMKADEKAKAMNLFVKGQTQIMVATTVIEVGVNVPNASVMIIESAERFGLSQLHQLRGRVGRGGDQSYCVLMSSFKLSSEARKRLQTMVDTTDGFAIAEADLKLRGPGDIAGTQQSGVPLNLKIASLSKDGQILQFARQIAMDVLEKDRFLQNPLNVLLVNQLKALNKSQINWGVIS